MNLLSEFYDLDKGKLAAFSLSGLSTRPAANHCMSPATLERLLPKVPYAQHADFRRRNSEAVPVPSAAGPRHTCPICLAGFEPHDDVRVLQPCGHFFHASEECIDAWICKSEVMGMLDGCEMDDKTYDLSFASDCVEPLMQLVCGSCPSCRREIILESGRIILETDIPNRYGLITYLSNLGWDLNPNMLVIVNPGSRKHRRNSSGAWSFSLAPGFDPVVAAALTAEEERLQQEEEQKKWYNRNPVTRGLKKMLDPQRHYVDDRGQRWTKGFRGIGLAQFITRD